MLQLGLENLGLNENLFKNGKIAKKIKFAHENLHSMDKSGGTGWVELPSLTTKSELLLIKEKAKEIQDMANLLIVVGVGGSVNGTKSAIEILQKHNFKVEVAFVGDSFDASAIQRVLDNAKTKEVCVNVVSKSGNTTETLLAFHLVEEFMKKKYKKGEYKKRIFVTTDHEKGILREIANKEGYPSFVFPRTIGGRYSLLSIVGLLPMAVAGINIERVMSGAKEAEENCSLPEVIENPAYKYAVSRYLINKKKKKSVEVFASFDSRLRVYFEWLKQLFGESEGKDKKGLYVTSLTYPSDLHSMGQFLEDGSPVVFETIFDIKKPSADLTFDKIKENSPLALFENKSLSEISRATLEGVKSSHAEKGIPLVSVEIEDLSEESFGYMAQFFMLSAATSAYLFGVNPFDQPAVEGYKQKTRILLETKK